MVFRLVDDHGLVAFGTQEQAEEHRPLLSGRELMKLMTIRRTTGPHLDARQIVESHCLQFEDDRPSPNRFQLSFRENRARLIRQARKGCEIASANFSAKN